MTTREQIEAFAGELDNLIERFELEFDLPNVAVVGVLTLKTHALLNHQLQQAGEDDDEGAMQ